MIERPWEPVHYSNLEATFLIGLSVLLFILYLFLRKFMKKRIKKRFQTIKIAKERKKNPCYGCPSVRKHHCNGCFRKVLKDYKAERSKNDG